MSAQITTAFVNQFSANVTMLSQQMGSLLRSAVDVETINGEKAFFDQVGQAAAVQKTTRNSDTPIMETPHARRQVSLKDFEYADLVDDQDKIRMLIDPTSTYAQAAAAAIGRAMDDEIISALLGSSNTGKTGSTSVALPAAQKIAHGSAGLTIAKLVEAKQKLDEKSVDPSIRRYIAVSPKQISDLLNNTTVTSADFNTVRALLISLNKFFKRHNVQLYKGNGDAFKLKYSRTKEAVKFAFFNLREEMYDEEGENVGWFFQHPVALEKERLELI